MIKAESQYCVLTITYWLKYSPTKQMCNDEISWRDLSKFMSGKHITLSTQKQLAWQFTP